MFSVLDLFSGVGAYSLGLQRTGGFRPVAFCEIEAFPRRTLNKNWPDVPTYEDVRDLTADRLRTDGIVPDWIVAGWPCQGNSPAGTGLGMDDPRSGLWSEIARLAGEIRPEGLLLENSSNLLNINDGRDFGRVLGDLATLRMHVEWHCLPAAAFDAPHIRDRVWIIATRADVDSERGQVSASGQHPTIKGGDSARDEGALANPDTRQRGDARQAVCAGGHTPNASAASDVTRIRRQPRRPEPTRVERRPVFDGDDLASNIDRLAPVGAAIARQERVSWQSISDFRRVVHGDADGLDGFAITTERVPNRVERIRALGNLNPPIIPEMIGRAILSSLLTTSTGEAA